MFFFIIIIIIIIILQVKHCFSLFLGCWCS